ncbi:DUF5076 domain-containing protein [Ideonella alba]|uniref:DUF5076 domain-containing protein n=1 Tax=Ideonella alba TaxID=2824118 RepID=A0A941BGJ9_9BURK|nr:DUF5076 domain-containing protein [Ideonella alba]MBQ0930618.1 DUF5076 domain-containing protein [Ideonella alba]
MKSLVVPPAAVRDDNSIQMLSGWIAEQGMHCTLNIGFFDGQGHKETEAWGIFLADVVRHIANAWSEERGVDAADSVASILQSLNDELDTPTSDVSGGFHPGHS